MPIALSEGAIFYANVRRTKDASISTYRSSTKNEVSLFGKLIGISRSTNTMMKPYIPISYDTDNDSIRR